MIEDNPEHVWVRVDRVIETLLGLEPGALTENPEVAPYPTRLAPDGTGWLVLIPPRVLEGRVWVGSEAAIDRLQDSKSRRSILSRSSLPPSLLEPGRPAIREGRPSPSGAADFGSAHRGCAAPVMRWSSLLVHCDEPALSIPRRGQMDVREKMSVQSKVQGKVAVKWR